MLYNILKISLILGVASVASTAVTFDNDSPGRNIWQEKVGDRVYHFSNDMHNWFDAKWKCKSLNGFLATLERPSDQRIISEHMVEYLPNDHYWWIYATDLYEEGTFLWSANGGPANNGTWAPGQPDNYGGDENCVHLKYSYNDLKRYEMNDWDCLKKANYICEFSMRPDDDNIGDSINNFV